MTYFRPAPREARARSSVLALGALGVVFGDIGTSVLYAMQAVLAGAGGAPVDATVVYGMTSMLVWSLLLIVTVLYVRLLMSADNAGEGGLLALLGLIRRSVRSARTVGLATALGIVGAAMFLGDSIITPAISVLSAVEGLEAIDPGFRSFVVPVTVTVLAILFVVQRYGTGVIGRWFGPIMGVWFVVILVLGAASLARHPSAVTALSPHWIVLFVAGHPSLAFLSLGSVVLAITGAEALYADMGHFGRRPITSAWLLLVLPALVVCYLGQAALAVRTPQALSDPFFLMVPVRIRLPVVILATVATIIASQAVVSGAFTVVGQASRLGLLPVMRTVHTSRSRPRQIYLPATNWLLAVAVLALVLGFRSAAALASAYGLAVSVTIAMTTCVFLLLQARGGSRTPRIVVTVILLAIVALFVAGNLPKIVTGGWLPLGIGGVLAVAMFTWRRGQRLIAAALRREQPTPAEFASQARTLAPPPRQTPGIGVFLTRDPATVPFALEVMLTQAHVRHRHTVLLSWETTDSPFVAPGERMRVEKVPGLPGVSSVSARFGYMEKVDIADVVARSQDASVADEASTVYYLSVPVVVFGGGAMLMRWQQYVFLGMYRLVLDPVEVLDLPRADTIVIGREVAVRAPAGV